MCEDCGVKGALESKELAWGLTSWFRCAEQEEVVCADFCSDLNVGSIQGSNQHAAVHGELHVARSTSFHPCRAAQCKIIFFWSSFTTAATSMISFTMRFACKYVAKAFPPNIQTLVSLQKGFQKLQVSRTCISNIEFGFERFLLMSTEKGTVHLPKSSQQLGMKYPVPTSQPFGDDCTKFRVAIC